jgi:hypothetical protein
VHREQRAIAIADRAGRASSAFASIVDALVESTRAKRLLAGASEIGAVIGRGHAANWHRRSRRLRCRGLRA